MDSEMSRLLCHVFENFGIHLLFGKRVCAAQRINNELNVTLETGEVLRPDIALFAAGRTVNTEGLGLEAAGVKLNARGAVAVSDKSETSVDGIYAAGDLIGPSLSSISMEQGRVAACHAFDLRFKEKMHPLPMSAVYSVRQEAGVGLTEGKAQKQRVNDELDRHSFGPSHRG